MSTELKPCKRCGMPAVGTDSGGTPSGLHYPAWCKCSNNRCVASVLPCAVDEWNSIDNLENVDDLRQRLEKVQAALSVVLDQVDYTSGACQPTEMVGAVLTKQVICLARKALKGDTK